MAELLSSQSTSTTRIGPPGWWPVDFVMIPYLAFTAAPLVLCWARIPDAWWLLAAHLLGVGFVLAAMRSGWSVFRHWYPLAFIPLCYKEMSLFIAALRHGGMDPLIAHLDYRLWGVHVTVWLERFSNPVLTEVLQVVYTFFIPSVILVAILLWLPGRYEDFRYYAFLVTLGFLSSYAGYFAVPVRGPRFFLAHLQHIPLQGVWLFERMQHILDRLESAHYDCFPSGHTAMTLVAWWSTRRISMKLFAVYSVYSVLIVCATVYLRYHYTIDVVAGIVLAAAVLAAAPPLFRVASAYGARHHFAGGPVRQLPQTQEDN